MRYLLIVFGLFLSFFGNAQSQGVTNAQTKLRPNQLRWSPTDATNDSVYIIRADTATGEPGWYLVTLGGGGGVADTTLSGDVIGGLNSTFVRKINGVTVENKTPQNREVLTYNGTQWTPDSIDLADLPQMNASRLLGRGSTTSGAPEQLTAGTGLRISTNILETHLTAGTGITLSGANPLQINNSLPDVTVSVSGGGINTVSGTYPNFTVTGTEVDGSITNEIQTLSRPLQGTLRLTTNGASNFVNLPDSSATNELQTISTGTNTLTLNQSGGTVTVDTDPANEIQTIDTLAVASGLLRLKLSGSAVKTLATSNFATSPAGSSMQVQYNNAGSFGALDSFTVFANPDRVGIGVPVPTARLDIQGSGSTSATNALRIRNSAGTEIIRVENGTDIRTSGSIYPTAQTWSIGKRGSNDYLYGAFNSGATIVGQHDAVNRNGIFFKGGVIGNIEGDNDINFRTASINNILYIKSSSGLIGMSVTAPLAAFHNNANTSASTPSMLLSGTGFSGGTATTTKPTFLIEPTGTTSTGWSTSGTKLGVNAESGFTGNLLDLQLAASSKLKVDYNGKLTSTATSFNMATQTPSSASATGTAGDIAWDSNYIYVCVATNTWKRVAIATW